jgi:cytochrome c peroxidase
MTDDDLGRGALRPDVGYLQHAFKTPGLRQIGHRGPFMHDGTLPDLDAVIDHYATPRVQRESIPDYIRGFALAPDERAALKAFLATLSTAEPDRPR